MDELIVTIRQGVQKKVLHGFSHVELLFAAIDQEVSEDVLLQVLGELDDYSLTGTARELDMLIEELVSLGGDRLKKALLDRIKAVGQAIVLIEYLMQKSGSTREAVCKTVLDSMSGEIVGKQKRMIVDPAYRALLVQYLHEARKNNLQRYVETQGHMSGEIWQFMVNS